MTELTEENGAISTCSGSTPLSTTHKINRPQQDELFCRTPYLNQSIVCSNKLHQITQMNLDVRHPSISSRRTLRRTPSADHSGGSRINRVFEGGAVAISCENSPPRKHRDKTSFMHSSTRSCHRMPRRRLLLALSSCLLFSSPIIGVNGSLIGKEDTRRKKFLRTPANDRAQNDAGPKHRRLSSAHDDTYEIDDYETLHERLSIPLLAMGASLMGIVNESENGMPEKGHAFPFAGTNEAMRRLADLDPKDHYDDRRDADAGHGIFAFAGTNQAMHNLASAEAREKPSAHRGRRMLSPHEEEPVGNTSYETTLSHIVNSRSSLLWSSESRLQEEASVKLSTFGASQHVLKSPKHTAPMLERTKADLDQGRYLVGLEVRDVQSHQQILVDYDASTEARQKPIRVKFTAVEDNDMILLPQLMETSFSAAANIWAQALRVTPVPDKIFPTVTSCGAATVPSFDRENGIEDADIVIYVSSNNRFCGGALMHSAVCDFDQFTRPLVGNINICTNNLRTSNITMSVQDSTLTEYASYLTTETGRVLGASTSLLKYYINPQTMSRYGSTERSLTCADGKEETMKVPNIIFEEKDTEGYVSYEIRTPRVTEIVRNHFDCMILTGAKLEQGKGSIGCFGGFLDDHVFYSEELTGFEATSSKGPSISPLTLALLEDSSWYTANYKVSAETSFGRGAGCQFARSGCLFDEASSEINSDASTFHCTEIGEMGCDASHSYKARCDFLDSVGSSFCPMHAREPISCTDSSAFLATQGEFFGDSSKCFHTSKGEPMCLRGECNTLTSTIDVYYDGKKVTCQKDDQIIEVDSNTGLHIKCPKIAAVCPSLSCPSNCSGRGVCDRDKDGKHSCICDDPFDASTGCYGDYNADEL